MTTNDQCPFQTPTLRTAWFAKQAQQNRGLPPATPSDPMTAFPWGAAWGGK